MLNVMPFLFDMIVNFGEKNNTSENEIIDVIN